VRSGGVFTHSGAGYLDYPLPVRHTLDNGQTSLHEHFSGVVPGSLQKQVNRIDARQVPITSSLSRLLQPNMSTPLTVGVIGPAGFTGSHICVELLERGHTVVGLSRHPEKLGSHPKYIPKPIDVQNSSVVELAEAISGLDVLISSYAPDPASTGNLFYSKRFTLLMKHWYQGSITNKS